MNQQEIERKFLVKGDGWRGRGEGVLFRQGYIAHPCGRSEGHAHHQISW